MSHNICLYVPWLLCLARVRSFESSSRKSHFFCTVHWRASCRKMALKKSAESFERKWYVSAGSTHWHTNPHSAQGSIGIRAAAHAHTHKHTQIHTDTYTHTQTQAHTRTHTHTRAHTHTHTHLHGALKLLLLSIKVANSLCSSYEFGRSSTIKHDEKDLSIYLVQSDSHGQCHSVISLKWINFLHNRIQVLFWIRIHRL